MDNHRPFPVLTEAIGNDRVLFPVESQWDPAVSDVTITRVVCVTFCFPREKVEHLYGVSSTTPFRNRSGRRRTSYKQVRERGSDCCCGLG